MNKIINYIDKIPYAERYKKYALYNRDNKTYIAPVDEDDMVLETKADKILDIPIIMINGATHLLITEEGFHFCVDTWDGLQAVPNFYPGLGDNIEKQKLQLEKEETYLRHYLWE